MPWVAALALIGAAAGCGKAHGPYTELTWRASPTGQGALTKSNFDHATSIMRARLSKLGAHGKVSADERVHTITARIDGGMSDPALGGTILGKTAELDFYDLVPALESPSIDASGQSAVPFTSLYKLLSAVQSTAGTPSGYVLFKPASPATYVKVTGPAPELTGSAGLLGAYHGTPPAGWKVLKVPERTAVVGCPSSAQVCPGDPRGAPPPGGTDWYLFKHGAYPGDRYATDSRYPNMTGGDLKLSKVQQDFDPNGQPIVLLGFTSHGNDAFKEVTQNEAARGRATGVPANQCGNTCSFAIVLDDQIESFPTIDPDQNPQGIDPTGTGAEINNIGSTDEAKRLALVLQTGSLPFRLTLLSVRTGKQ